MKRRNTIFCIQNGYQRGKKIVIVFSSFVMNFEKKAMTSQTGLYVDVD